MKILIATFGNEGKWFVDTEADKLYMVGADLYTPPVTYSGEENENNPH